MAKAKPKNIVESYMAGLFQDAKNAVDSVTDPNDITIGSGSDQDQIRITKGPDKDQVRIRSVSGSDQDKVSPKDQDQIRTLHEVKSITIGSGSVSLSKSQTIVFLWLKQRGQNGVFNKPEIERSLSMPYITVRKAIRKLQNNNIIILNYDTCHKNYEYRITNEHMLKLNKSITIGSGSDQDQIRIRSEPLNSSSSSIIKKPSTCENECITNSETIIKEIMNSDPEYQYWLAQQVLPKQIEGWRCEFGLDIKTILQNLCYVRWQITQKKITVEKSAADYIYVIMKKNGGVVNKPAGYKTMAELDLEFYENWKQKRFEHKLKIERIKNEIIITEIEPKVEALLNKPNLDDENIAASIEKIHSSKRRKRIVECIKSSRPMTDGDKAALKNYLIDRLSVDILNNTNSL